MDFTVALDDPVASQFFMDFLQSQVMVENLLFYNETKAYNEVEDKSERVLLAKSIYDRYVKETAEDRVNLDDAFVQSIEQGLNEASQDLFESSRERIVALMRMDSWVRFKKSPFYVEAEKALEMNGNADQNDGSEREGTKAKKKGRSSSLGTTEVELKPNHSADDQDPSSTRHPNFLRLQSKSKSEIDVRSKRKSQSVLEGYLLKKGRRGLWWKRRFFVVQLGENLEYYRSNMAMDGEVVNSVALSDIISITKAPHAYPYIRPDLRGLGFAIECVVNGVRTQWVLCCLTIADRDRWISGLNDRIAWNQFSKGITGSHRNSRPT